MELGSGNLLLGSLSLRGGNMKKINQKGEGLVSTLLILALLAGAGYAGYVYLWPMVSGPDKPAPAAAAQVTPVPAESTGKAGGMAAAAVQAGQAAGDLYSSGR